MVLITLIAFWASSFSGSHLCKTVTAVSVFVWFCYFGRGLMKQLKRSIITTQWLFGTHPKSAQVGKTKQTKRDRHCCGERRRNKGKYHCQWLTRDYRHHFKWTVAYLHRLLQALRSMQQFGFIVMRQLISIKSFIVQCALTQVQLNWR